MTTLSIVQAIQTANATVTGITQAPQPGSTPPALNADMLPCAVTLPGQATWSGSGLGGGRLCERVYVVRVFVAPDSTADVGDTMGDLLALIEAMGVYWRGVKSVGGAMVRRVEDAGALRTLGYGGSQFFGFEVRLTLWEDP